MEKEKRSYVAHCLVLPFPAQGHINPMLQFSKRLVQRGVKVTLVTVVSNWKIMCNKNFTNSIEIESISDGYDDGGLEAAESLEVYMATFWKVGPQTLAELVQKLEASGYPADCVIYDAFVPWALDVAKKFGLFGAAFFTQSCSTNNIYFHAYKKLIELPLSKEEYVLPGLPKLAPRELPSFLSKYGSYPGYFDVLVNQFYNIDKVDWVLANTFYELEQGVVDWWLKICPLKPIGPCVPSMFMDKRLQDDKDYGVSMYNPNSTCFKWLDDKPKGSVVYVSFGSFADLSEEQTEELAYGLRDSGSYFIWVVRESEQSKLPKEFVDTSEKGLIVTWCPQLEVLTHQALGCFLTHCGWNSTLEAVSLGVPLIAMPLWTDQLTNAKLISDVWKVGVKVVADEKEVVRRETIKHCIKEIMETERGNEIKNNSIKWKNLAKAYVDEGGSSDKNIAEFVAELSHHCAALD